jgi:hypothetical protein
MKSPRLRFPVCVILRVYTVLGILKSVFYAVHFSVSDWPTAPRPLMTRGAHRRGDARQDALIDSVSYTIRRVFHEILVSSSSDVCRFTRVRVSSRSNTRTLGGGCTIRFRVDTQHDERSSVCSCTHVGWRGRRSSYSQVGLPPCRRIFGNNRLHLGVATLFRTCDVVGTLFSCA